MDLNEFIIFPRLKPEPFASLFLFFISCVFGSVVEGMDVVKAIEAVGSQSGSTKAKVVIVSCGQL